MGLLVHSVTTTFAITGLISLVILLNMYKVPECDSGATFHTHALNTLKIILQALLFMMLALVVLRLLHIPYSPIASSIMSALTVVCLAMNEQVGDLIQGGMYTFFTNLCRTGNIVKLSIKSCDDCNVQNIVLTIHKLRPFVLVGIKDGSTINIRYSAIRAVQVLKYEDRGSSTTAKIPEHDENAGEQDSSSDFRTRQTPMRADAFQ